MLQEIMGHASITPRWTCMPPVPGRDGPLRRSSQRSSRDVRRCSLVRMWTPARDSRSAHGLLYLAAVRANQREQEHRQGTVDTDPSLVSYRRAVGYRRSPGDLASCVTRLIGWSRMSSWSTMVDIIQAHGYGGS